MLELSQIRISRIIFQYQHRSTNTASGTKAGGDSKTPSRVSFVKDPLAMDVDLQIPRDSEQYSDKREYHW